jgi:hypothetical protein
MKMFQLNFLYLLENSNSKARKIESPFSHSIKKSSLNFCSSKDGGEFLMYMFKHACNSMVITAWSELYSVVAYHFSKYRLQYLVTIRGTSAL